VSRNSDDGCSAYEALLDPVIATERVRRIAAGAAVVDSYDRTHACVIAAGEKNPAERAGLSASLADRAFAAEAALRSLAGDHLDTLNELRDSGAMQLMVEKATPALAEKDFEWSRRLAEAGRRAEKEFGIDAALLERAVEQLDRYGFDIAAGTDREVDASISSLKGKRERFSVRGAQRPGDPGRVSREQLLGPQGIVASVPLLVPDDCHHRSKLLPHEHATAIDLYSTNVAGLAYAREAMYRHARRIDEVGPSAFRGNDPFTAVVVGIIVVGVIIAGIGVAMVAGGDADGWWLIALGGIVIAGGICVGVGACEFVVTLLIGVGV
jgi:hypothetical protein